MQEKASIMNVSDIASINTIEKDTNKLTKSLQITNSLRQRKFSLASGIFDQSNEIRLKNVNIKNRAPIACSSENSNNIRNKETTPKIATTHLHSKFRSRSINDAKHDSRLANEIFQVCTNQLSLFTIINFLYLKVKLHFLTV